jgi:hypothetical protein
MFGFLKGLFGETKPAAKRPAAPVASKGKVAPKPLSAAKPAPSESRAELLRRAQEVHRAKRKILDHLSDEDRAKLVSMAILAFMNDGREPDDRNKK